MADSKGATNREVPLWLVAVVAIPAAGAGFVAAVPGSAETFEHFGGALGGYAALVGVLVAAVKGTREWDEWKRRRVYEFAGDAVVAALRFGEALTELVPRSQINLDNVDEEDPRAWARAEYERHSTKMREELGPFRDASRAVAAFLPWDATEALNSLRRLHGRIETAWFRYRLLPGQPRWLELYEIGQNVQPAVDQVVDTLREYTRGDKEPVTPREEDPTE